MRVAIHHDVPAFDRDEVAGGEVAMDEVAAEAIEVKDTGIGIPKDALGHIYERFYRVDKSHSREIGGTGLGLAITKNAISMHRGTIKVTSEENVGTTVLVSIPLIYVKKDQ